MNRLKQSLSSIQAPQLPTFGSQPQDEDRPTSAPLPHSRLEQLTARRKLADDLNSTFAVLHKTLSKQRPGPRSGGNATAFPSRWVSETMREGAQELEQSAGADDKVEGAYCQALSAVSDLHAHLAELSTELTDALANGYLTHLEHRVEDHRQLEKSLKEAEKKRVAFEGVIAKVEKSKKDRSEHEEELDAAEWAYTDACDSLSRKADQADAAVVKDVEALEQLVEDQLAYARKYVEILEECKAVLPSSSSLSSIRVRSSSVSRTQSATRMSRSQSESSVRSTQLPSTSSSIFSSLGPNRSRRSTVSSQVAKEDKDKSDLSAAGESTSGSNSSKNRSRSGSMLERFALGNKGKKNDTTSTSVAAENGDDPAVLDKASPTAFGASIPSRFAPSNLSMPAMPGLPTLGSLRKLASPSGGRFVSLGDEPQRDSSTPSPTFSSSSRPGSSSSNRPPLFKRTQTAPASTSSSPSNTSPRPASPRRAVPPLPSSSNGPVGQTYRAQWAYTPARPRASTSTYASSDGENDDEDDGELTLEPGDVVRVEKEVNANWWIGRLVTGEKSGMFPSAYVVPCADPSSPSSAGAGRRNASDEERWTTFTRNDGGSTDDFSSADGHYGRSYGDASGGGASTENDSDAEEEEAQHGLLGSGQGGGGGRTSSPYRGGPGSGAPLAARRTAPRPPASRSRSTTVVVGGGGDEIDPFGEDQVSFAEARGVMSR
ncbi:hypothetical protein JCM8547_001379 [Rhodosporidiobolus lusitaniae]